LLKELEGNNMPSVFLTSDTHFGHLGVCKFTGPDGVTKLRPWDTPEEMDEEMVRRWNETVRPNDKVYHLGDVVINRKALKTLSRLNGDKVLIKGNHDIFKLDEYPEYFITFACVECGVETDIENVPDQVRSKARGRKKKNSNRVSTRVSSL
jgi:calcineurin-like phosphoesterase family protein